MSTFHYPQVEELITGLSDLGCTRTTGEDQNVCVLSDSFDTWGHAAGLQQFGYIPAVEVIKVTGMLELLQTQQN